MTATLLARQRPDQLSTGPASWSSTLRFELVKVLTPWRMRLLLLACWTVPAILVAVISRQSALPTDTLFGRWMGTTGWAGSLVLLSFVGTWVLPLVVSLVAGDAFAVEDRLGTWGALLVTVRSVRRVFVTKALAAFTVLVLIVIGLAASSVLGGLVTSGHHALVGLDGAVLQPGAAAAAVALAWATALPPALAFAALGVLGSVALGRTSTGLLLPAVLVLLMQAVSLLPMPVVLRLSLPSLGSLGWRGLLTTPASPGLALVTVVVSVVWALVALALAGWLFDRRDFTDSARDGAGGRGGLQIALALTALVTVCAGVVAVVTTVVGVTRAGIEGSLATAFSHLYRLQSHELHRPDVPEQQLAVRASCDKGGPRTEDVGPGHDWRCVVSWRIPGATGTGTAVYQLDVGADGRYVADGDGPQAVNGYFQVRTPNGDVPNPLWQVDGAVGLIDRP